MPFAYPRPQLERAQWLSLDGRWRFRFDRERRFRHPAEIPDWPLQIEVPYPPESPASGIGERGFNPAVWYQRDFEIEAFRAGDALRLESGWSGLEENGPFWSGVWSTGDRSRIVLRIDGAPAESLLMTGNYHAPNRETRVTVNGHDLGWHALDREGPLALPPAARARELVIELEHAAPNSPGASDGRLLAFFLRQASVRQPAAPPVKQPAQEPPPVKTQP